MMNSAFGISVVICAYTDARWESLVAAVESVRSQTVPARQIVIVIDHNPVLLERVQAQFPDLLVVGNQQERGISGGRNSGVAVSEGQVVAFLDDDAVAQPDWIEQMTLSYQNPEVIGVGGWIEPMWQTARPTWFPEEFNWVVGCSYLGLPLTAMPVRNLIGANMSFRREVFKVVGGFKQELGHVGKSSLGCEETELSIRLRQCWPHKVLLYNPLVKVHHHAPVDRTRWRYFRQRCYNEGLSKAVVARSVGVQDGLSSERHYTLRVLPKGVVRGMKDTLVRRDLSGIGRAGAITLGLAYTTAGYASGVVSHHLSVRKLPRASKAKIIVSSQLNETLIEPLEVASR